MGAYLALWVIARPSGQPTERYLGEMAGMLAIVLLSLALVTSSGLMRVLEPAFGGFDRVLVWHRRLALAGVLLIIPHVVLVTSVPGNPYSGASRGRARAISPSSVWDSWCCGPLPRACAT